MLVGAANVAGGRRRGVRRGVRRRVWSGIWRRVWSRVWSGVRRRVRCWRFCDCSACVPIVWVFAASTAPVSVFAATLPTTAMEGTADPLAMSRSFSMVGRVAFVALVGFSEMLCALSNSIRQRIQDRIHEIADRWYNSKHRNQFPVTVCNLPYLRCSIHNRTEGSKLQ